jgi:superfamily II DNA or RNA helicase
LSRNFTEDARAGTNDKSALRDYVMKKTAKDSSPFGRKSLLVINDEIHLARKPNNKIYRALRWVSEDAVVRVGLSATPVITAPEDLFGIGCILRAPHFLTPEDEEACRELAAIMTREIRKTRNKAKAEGTNTGNILKREIARRSGGEGSRSGSSAPGIVAVEEEVPLDAVLALGELPNLYQEHALKMRNKLMVVCIRRTQDAKDYLGNPIINVMPYSDINLRLQLYLQEEEEINRLLEDLDAEVGGRYQDNNVSFVLNTRVA